MQKHFKSKNNPDQPTGLITCYTTTYLEEYHARWWHSLKHVASDIVHAGVVGSISATTWPSSSTLHFRCGNAFTMACAAPPCPPATSINKSAPWNTSPNSLTTMSMMSSVSEFIPLLKSALNAGSLSASSQNV